MTFQEFDKLQLQLFDDILKIAKTKGVEYASSEDRLANFKRLGVELDIPATKIGYIFFKKHLDSICTYLKDGKEHSEESIRGRFLDAINYLTLIYGLIEDQRFVHNSLRYIYNGGAPIFCKQCKLKIEIGEEYNSDPSGYNHYKVCPINDNRIQKDDKTEETRTSTENK